MTREATSGLRGRSSASRAQHEVRGPLEGGSCGRRQIEHEKEPRGATLSRYTGDDKPKETLASIGVYVKSE